ncbi:hypothetical protein ACI2KR_21350 [Pseudomonas luteola]
MNWELLTLLSPFREASLKIRLAICICFFGVVLVALWCLAGTPFGKASGLQEVKYRIEMAGKASFWTYRALRGNESSYEQGTTRRGYIDKGQREYLLVYLYEGEGRTRQIVTMANVNNKTVTLERFAERYRGKQLRFDLYKVPEEKYPRALVWNIEVPLNLEVIAEGGGPDLNPPTNIADWIFAKYYWRLAQNGI